MTKIIVLGILILSISFSAFAEATGEGGGHPLESDFKARLEIILDQVAKMSDEAKEKLTFNYQSLLTMVKLEVITPLCAEARHLAVIHKENKLAWVFDENRRIIRLDCSSSEEVTEKWSKRFQAKDAFGDVFFLHEGIRAQAELNDDNYVYSSSYLDAYRVDEKQRSQRIFWLQNTRNNNCSLNFSTSVSENRNKVYLLKDAKIIRSFDLGQIKSIDISEEQFMNASNDLAIEARKSAVYAAQESGCFLGIE